MASQNPTHWNQLYNSDNDGLSLNRFEHHVMGYRGPTVTFFYAEDQRIFCLAVDQPWKESINFWGSPNTIILKISPEYRVLDRTSILTLMIIFEMVTSEVLLKIFTFAMFKAMRSAYITVQNSIILFF